LLRDTDTVELIYEPLCLGERLVATHKVALDAQQHGPVQQVKNLIATTPVLTLTLERLECELGLIGRQTPFDIDQAMVMACAARKEQRETNTRKQQADAQCMQLRGW
jgi:hypothetical protein